jgi:hypothetical protein
MIQTTKITRVMIQRIKSISVGSIEGSIEIDSFQREITIWNEYGEKIELILEADNAETLDLNWLTPKVYKGKSMSEEEG